jgi:hypothetical protein
MFSGSFRLVNETSLSVSREAVVLTPQIHRSDNAMSKVPKKSRKRIIIISGPYRPERSKTPRETKRPTLVKVGGLPGDSSLKVERKRRHDKRRRERLPRGHLPHRGSLDGHVTIVKGSRVIEDRYRNGTFTITTQLLNNEVEVYDLLESHQGDFKHPNGHHFTKVNYKYGAGHYDNSDPQSANYLNLRDGTQVGPMSQQTDSGSKTTAYNTALASLYEQLRGDLDLSTDIAEAHKTKTMMRDTLRGMSNLALTFRKMKRSNPRDWGNLWLEFTYGWKPLSKAIFATLDKAIGQNPVYPITVKASSSQITSSRRVLIPDYPFPGATWQKDFVTKNRCRIWTRWAIQGSRLDELAGYTSLNPVSIAWELAPYSFVVDWIFNVGGYLRSYESALLYGTDFVDGFKTEGELAYCEERATGISNWPPPATNTERISTAGATEAKDKKRTVLTGVPYPIVPRFDPKLGPSRLISAAALLGQQLTSLKHGAEWGSMKKFGKGFDKAFYDFGHGLATTEQASWLTPSKRRR